MPYRCLQEDIIMKLTCTKVIAFHIVILLISGCVAYGPSTIRRDRIEYNTAISDSWKSQMLINIVRARYGDAPVFLNVDSVVTSYEVSGRGTANAGWSFQPFSANTSLAGEVYSATRPTITYSPMIGDKFVRSMMTPIPPFIILSLIQSGYPMDIVFGLLVKSANGVRNRFGVGSIRNPADSEFYSLLEKMRCVQQAGAMTFEMKKSGEAESVFLSLNEKSGKEIEADSAEVKKILGLDPQAHEYKVVHGHSPSNNREIAILSRSMFQILADLAFYVETPDTDVAGKRAYPGLKTADNKDPLTAQSLKICNSPQLPDDAYVAVLYDNTWFWIDNKDLPSKSTFSFLMFVFSVLETEGKHGVPVLTIPTR